jgi:hypothetical protein
MENRKNQETQAAIRAELRRWLEGGELDKDQIDKIIED